MSYLNGRYSSTHSRSTTPSMSRSVMSIFRTLPTLRHRPGSVGIVDELLPQPRAADQITGKLPDLAVPERDTILEEFKESEEDLGIAWHLRTNDEKEQEKTLHGAPRWTEGTIRKPEFVSSLERKLDKELRLLSNKGIPNVDERIRIFQAIALEIVPCFRHYGTVLSRIFNEYDSYVQLARTDRQRLVELEAEKNETRRIFSHELSLMKEKLQAAQTQGSERAARLEKAAKECDNPVVLHEFIESLQRRLESEQQQRRNVERLVHQTKSMSAEFQRALQSMEENFRTVVDEKDIQISRLRDELDLEKIRRKTDVEKLQQLISDEQDTTQSLQIALNTRRQREELFINRVRHQESHIAVLRGRLEEAQADCLALEQKLDRLGKPGTITKIRDPAMTPRPSKVELVKRVPALGNPAQYTSTNALIQTLVEIIVAGHERERDADNAMSFIEEEIERARREAKEKMREEYFSGCGSSKKFKNVAVQSVN